jgi:hypothetical protein
MNAATFNYIMDLLKEVDELFASPYSILRSARIDEIMKEIPQEILS